MSHRTDRVFLIASEERCEPSKPCVKCDTCAHYLAALPAQGAKLEDHSLTAIPSWGGPPTCFHFLSLRDWRCKPTSAPQKRVHPPIGSVA